MSTELACPHRQNRALFGSPSGEGIDDTARARVLQALSFWNGRESVAITVGQLLVDAELTLWDTYQECSRPNWDGYGAKPVTRETFKNAVTFLRSLPTTLPIPDIAAEPGGEIGFEWRRDDALAALTIDQNSRLHYAAVLGRETAHGSTDFVDLLPSRIVELIARVVR